VLFRPAQLWEHSPSPPCCHPVLSQVSTLTSQLRQRDQECAQLRQAAAGQAAVATATGEAAAAVEEQLLALTQELGEARQQLAEQQLRWESMVTDPGSLSTGHWETLRPGWGVQ
jgi:DNA repair exonuclease SbcCD ATPase subunit